LRGQLFRHDIDWDDVLMRVSETRTGRLLVQTQEQVGQASGAEAIAAVPRGVGRIVISPPLGGAMNMAIDDALLANATPQAGPTLRIYRWAEPTVSLGYFQSIGSRQQHLSSSKASVVRRSSGGGAIIHDQELTYSLVLPTSDKSAGGAAPWIYRAVHNAFVECLGDNGISATRFGNSGRQAPTGEPFLCFQRRNAEDLIVSGYKVLGSAQRRGPVGLLQHGSLLIASSASAPELPGLLELTSRKICFDTLAEQIVEKLATVCGVAWSCGGLTDGEECSASVILKEKYSSLEWTTKR
jgi:lipoate-protein ligase A